MNSRDHVLKSPWARDSWKVRNLPHPIHSAACVRTRSSFPTIVRNSWGIGGLPLRHRAPPLAANNGISKKGHFSRKQAAIASEAGQDKGPRKSSATSSRAQKSACVQPLSRPVRGARGCHWPNKAPTPRCPIATPMAR
jgi:hypothetical protein